MAFKLSSVATLNVELKRVLIEQIEGALAELEGGEASLDERIHECRQHLKRVRAVLRLLEGTLGRGRFRRIDQAVRSIANGLAAARDSAALHESFDQLLAKVEASARAPFEERLTKLSSTLFQVEERVAAASEAALSQRGPLTAVRAEVLGARLEAPGFELVREGFRDSFARGRRALRRVESDPTDERLHSLRTQAKRYQNQLSLFEPLWPRVLRVERQEITRMTEALGDDHDLTLLEAKFREVELEPELRAFLDRASAERKAVLRSRALKIARRVYAESPKGIAQRFACYYAAFRAAANDEPATEAEPVTAAHDEPVELDAPS
jgi:CHAD domain-containing protein